MVDLIQMIPEGQSNSLIEIKLTTQRPVHANDLNFITTVKVTVFVIF